MPTLQHHRIRRFRLRGVSPVLIVLIGAIVFSALIAAVWQLTAPPPAEPVQYIPDPSLLSSAPNTAHSGPDEPSSQSAVFASSSCAVSSLPDDASSESAAPSGAVPGQPRVTSAYFDDAAFVGDSITTGIKLYDIMSNADVFAGVGVSLENILTKQAVTTGDKTMTIPQALDGSNPKKIYIMLGANSLGGSFDYAIELYGKLVDAILKQHPSSLIYIQSVLPINEPIFKTKYSSDITNPRIDEFNARLCDLAAEKGVLYLDLASIFKDDAGAMPAEYTPDGIHINSAQYVMWFDYLKEHAVPIAK